MIGIHLFIHFQYLLLPEVSLEGFAEVLHN